MAIPVPSPLVEFILLGPLDDRRQIQDSPILGDVWVEYGKQPGARLDLLIVPFRAEHPGAVAAMIDDAISSAEDETASLLNQNSSTSVEDSSGVEDKSSVENKEAEQKKLPTWNQVLSHSDSSEPDENPKVAYLQGLVVARMKFEEVLTIVVPKTTWWLNKWHSPEEMKIIRPTDPVAVKPADTKREHDVQKFGIDGFKRMTERMKNQAEAWHQRKTPDDLEHFRAVERFLVLMGFILWAAQHNPREKFPTRPDDQIAYILKNASVPRIAKLLLGLTNKMIADTTDKPLVWQVSLNRRALPALSKSVPAVKADAAKTLFSVDCSNIGWAILDSGIDGNHLAFMKDGKSRVRRSFEFRNFRRVVSLSNTKRVIREQNLMLLLKQDGLLLTKPIWGLPRDISRAEKAAGVATENKKKAESAEAEAKQAWEAILKPGHPTEEVLRLATAGTAEATDREKAALALVDELKAKVLPPEQQQLVEAEVIRKADDALNRLAQDARNKGPVHWELVEELVEIEPGTKPQTNHGTHVAGILGACKDEIVKLAESRNEKPPGNIADGMCPDISLYDLRVLARDISETEFAIIAALQFIRYLNDRDNLLTIHGANLSLSIPHDVRNFACGRTPICDECERLVSSGVVVVAAAGNHGYKSFQTEEGSFDSYAAFSITDPGNAENVLTVGATHRFWPHTYGVSFFSSRGPTGDGRLKPDLVAPGERIRSTFPDNNWGDLDGTSMAAPHVSGAAAMLLARYSELIGQPMRVKRILCESATDLGRERSFQGRGMLDVLRSFQSI
jgi:subtilisin family serine protease